MSPVKSIECIEPTFVYAEKFDALFNWKPTPLSNVRRAEHRWWEVHYYDIGIETATFLIDKLHQEKVYFLHLSDRIVRNGI